MFFFTLKKILNETRKQRPDHENAHRARSLRTHRDRHCKNVEVMRNTSKVRITNDVQQFLSSLSLIELSLTSHALDSCMCVSCDFVYL